MRDALQLSGGWHVLLLLVADHRRDGYGDWRIQRRCGPRLERNSFIDERLPPAPTPPHTATSPFYRVAQGTQITLTTNSVTALKPCPRLLTFRHRSFRLRLGERSHGQYRSGNRPAFEGSQNRCCGSGDHHPWGNPRKGERPPASSFNLQAHCFPPIRGLLVDKNSQQRQSSHGWVFSFDACSGGPQHQP